MSSTGAMAEAVLAAVPDDVDAEVFVSSGTSALTRFANSFIHQNVAEEGMDITLRLAAGNRTMTATAKLGAPSDAQSFVERTVEAVRVAPPDDDWPGLTPPRSFDVEDHYDPGTAEVEPAQRARVVRSFIEADEGTNAAGYCQTEAVEAVYANSAGHQVSGRQSSAVLDGIHRINGTAGSAHRASARFSDLDGGEAGRLAVDRARRGRDPGDIEPGEYEVVLGPECVATIAIFLAFYGFNGKAVNEDQSFVELGEQQFDESFRLIDDATDPRAIGLGFDAEGVEKQRLELVTGGISGAVAWDRRQAQKAGTESTGHSLTVYGGYWGPIATDLFVGEGEASPEDLIGSVDRGLYVSTFNYCRVLDPRTTVTTGLTRNGTFLIEAGELTGAVKNLRFTQSLAGSLGPGQVLGVGNDARHADSEFSPTLVHAPSIHLASWRFTGGAAG